MRLRLGFHGENVRGGQLACKNNEFFTPQKLPAIRYLVGASKASESLPIYNDSRVPALQFCLYVRMCM